MSLPGVVLRARDVLPRARLVPGVRAVWMIDVDRSRALSRCSLLGSFAGWMAATFDMELRSVACNGTTFVVINHATE